VWNEALSAYRSIQVARAQHAGKGKAVTSLHAWHDGLHVLCTCIDGHAYFVNLDTKSTQTIRDVLVLTLGPNSSVIVANMQETRQITLP
jgi:hypothetical protein